MIFSWQNWKNTALEAEFIVLWKNTLQNGFNLFKLKIKCLPVASLDVENRKGRF